MQIKCTANIENLEDANPSMGDFCILYELSIFGQLDHISLNLMLQLTNLIYNLTLELALGVHFNQMSILRTNVCSIHMCVFHFLVWI